MSPKRFYPACSTKTRASSAWAQEAFGIAFTMPVPASWSLAPIAASRASTFLKSPATPRSSRSRHLNYPDSRSPSEAAERFGMALGNDAISNLMPEFWPDIKRRLRFGRHYFFKT
jgi:hypothetical protein